MEERLLSALRQSEIDIDTLAVQSAVLNRRANAISVSFLCLHEVSEPCRQRLKATLSDLLPELRVHVRFSEKESTIACIPEPEPNGPSTSYHSAEAVKATSPMDGQDGYKVLLGTAIRSAQCTPICKLTEGEGSVVIEGRVVSWEEKDGWGNKNDNGKKSYRVLINVTDETDSIFCVYTFYESSKRARFLGFLEDTVKDGENIRVRGVCKMTKFGKELQIYVNDINAASVKLRGDSAKEKRVELHLHTRMSMMDGLTDVSAAFKTAKRFGHKALAITDHGVVQSFPEAAKASKKTGVKAIFGVEGYLQHDTELTSTENKTFVVFDLETTGLKPEHAEIIELGAIKIRAGQVIDTLQTFVNDGTIVPKNITELTGITTDMLAGAPTIREVLRQFYAFAEGCCLVAHNAEFDAGFIRYHGARFGYVFNFDYADTLMLSRYLMHDLPNHKLDTVCEALQVDLRGHHRAVDDAKATADVFLILLDQLRTLNVHLLPVRVPEPPEPAVDLNFGEHKKAKKKHKTNHIIILAQTQDGIKNLYRLVSYAHLDHFRTRPIIPLSLLSIFRGGLILGSACEQGELYQAILQQKSAETIERLASFYDYLEIQPRQNNAFMVREGMASEERILQINREIVALADKLHKPVVATGDVHFLDPGDSIYREILMTKMGFSDADQQAPLYFKTTDEMLEEFAYLGAETAYRVVIETPNAIADLCGELKPFPDGTHAPRIEDAENILTNMTVSKAHEIYGDPLPPIVQARLDKELKSIIGNGFASLYLMAQRLVSKSLSDGYLVGSRGSVGSSFVATMAGITEVNALQPHYVCPNCKHSDFDVLLDQYACGVDMPDLNCPACGAKYNKMGFEIPFEVFLGFKGDKTPDIDLNFSGEYQPVAHKYVEEMFGKGHAFRAGTISGIADKKAYECVFSYMEKTGKVLRQAERERLVKGCLNVKVTTGQHPGGIVIVPKEDDILDYTPINYPADKKDKNTITTHFDFHAMDDRLVKLDILGHDDPTALRMLEVLTGLDPRTIPLDDKDTMKLYSSVEPLHIDLSGMECDVGSLGIPEYGTGFVRGVLEMTRPKTMEELVRIAGLTHGTDVWLNNAEPLVVNKIARLNEVLCTRDDIMNYLIAHGMEASLSFTIMERVRKGRGLTPEMEQAMKDGNIPAWFVDSCHKIKYMFPRGHAVAYAMMSFRIAYYKVHFPLEFYAVYFTVRADAFDVTSACGGADKVLAVIKELDKNAQFKDTAEKKRDKELQTILEVVYEMNLRGIELLPVDIYKSAATKFLVEGNALRPPFDAVPSVGANAAISLCENRGTTPFLSIEDFQSRTTANSGVISALQKCGCFEKLPETNQISLF
ncbi:MAG: PolC-type DNA polymerase III [Clostridia bacterium]